jgi:hypothetical protein
MIRFKPILNGHAITRFPFLSWDQTLAAVERQGVKVLHYHADPIPEVDRKGIVIRVHFEVVRACDILWHSSGAADRSLFQSHLKNQAFPDCIARRQPQP